MLRNRCFYIALAVFLLTRFFILKHPPLYYSDVSHDYERYANMWDVGLTPYYKHFYEYPPATIPLLAAPLTVDRAGWGVYYQNYRIQIFLLEIFIFLFIFKAITLLKVKNSTKIVSLAFYLFSPLIAKDFYYEGIDLVFSGSLAIAITLLLMNKLKPFVTRIFFWIFFWLSTSLKFLTAPLAAPYFFLSKLKFWQEVKAAGIAFFLIWGFPLLYFRSALAVMFVFHTQRHIKYASFPSYLVETINAWTQTETRVNMPPDFQLSGPLSDIAEKIVAIVFPVSIALVLAYGLYIIYRQKFSAYSLSLKLALVYIFTIFLTGKIFSQPFHIWYISLIALLPFKTIRHQLAFILPAIWLLIIDTSPWIKVDEAQIFIAPLTMKFVIYTLRFLPIFWLLAMSLKLPHDQKA